MSEDATARQGTVFDASDPQRLQRAIEMARDYRGDVTITRRSSGDRVEGYLFDCTTPMMDKTAVVRLLAAQGDRIAIPLDDIDAIHFSGRDTAEGKSFETWMKKYVERKMAGETASIESEPLE